MATVTVSPAESAAEEVSASSRFWLASVSVMLAVALSKPRVGVGVGTALLKVAPMKSDGVMPRPPRSLSSGPLKAIDSVVPAAPAV